MTIFQYYYRAFLSFNVGKTDNSENKKFDRALMLPGVSSKILNIVVVSFSNIPIF